MNGEGSVTRWTKETGKKRKDERWRRPKKEEDTKKYITQLPKKRGAGYFLFY